MPVNRWAYLEELKQLMQMGVIDDIALLSETDLKNKENIIKRKSLYSQLQGQLGQLQESLKDKDGTIETLERQLVQAGIKMKINDAGTEISKKKEEVKSGMNKDLIESEAKQKHLRNTMDLAAQDRMQKDAANADTRDKQVDNDRSLREDKANLALQNFEKDLERNKNND